MKKGKFFSLTVVAILVALFCVASVGLAAEKKDTLVVANIYDAKTLDPQATNDVASSGAMMQIYETLVALDDDNNVVPQLAEKW